MAIDTSQNASEVELPEGISGVVIHGKLSANFTLTVNGQKYLMDTAGVLVPSNDHQTPNLAQRVLEVGQRLRDGTVVLSVDLDKDEALFVPEKIFGGKAKFNYQDDVVEVVNRDYLHGHSDWRRITDDEGNTLCSNWNKVTTQDPEWYWLASRGVGHRTGSVRIGVYDVMRCNSIYLLAQVPVVRSGPAHTLDIQLSN